MCNLFSGKGNLEKWILKPKEVRVQLNTLPACPDMLRPTSSDLEMTAATNGEEKGCVWTGALPTGGGGNLTIPSWESMGYVAFVDGVPVGSDEDHKHGNGQEWTASIAIPPSTSSSGAGRTLTILAEELGCKLGSSSRVPVRCLPVPASACLCLPVPAGACRCLPVLVS